MYCYVYIYLTSIDVFYPVEVRIHSHSLDSFSCIHFHSLAQWIWKRVQLCEMLKNQVNYIEILSVNLGLALHIPQHHLGAIEVVECSSFKGCFPSVFKL